MRLATACCLLILSGAPPAFAQDRPAMLPTRDVSITYRLAEAAPGGELRMSWLVAEQKLRVDMPGGIGWSVVDQRARTMFMVLERQRRVLELPTQSAAGGLNLPAQPPADAHFTRAGTARIAGFECVQWRYADPTGFGEACLTADGVMLRSSGTHAGRSGSVEATEVDYAPQDPARFRLPPNYQAMPAPR